MSEQALFPVIMRGIGVLFIALGLVDCFGAMLIAYGYDHSTPVHHRVAVALGYALAGLVTMLASSLATRVIYGQDSDLV